MPCTSGGRRWLSVLILPIATFLVVAAFLHTSLVLAGYVQIVRQDDSGVGPTITSVSPNPVTGSNQPQWLRITGKGYTEAFAVRFLADSVDALITDSTKLRFVNEETVEVLARFGTEAGIWKIEVINAGGLVSEAYPFVVEAPAPVITSMSTMRKEVGSPGFDLEVYGTFSSYSILRWNGRSRPTTPIRSSSKRNAVTIGLKAPVLPEEIAVAGRIEITVLTPAPGGGVSRPMYLYTVSPRYYERTWFYVLLVLLTGLLATAFYRYRLRQMRQKMREQELVLLVEAKTLDLEEEKAKTQKQAQQLLALDRLKNRFFAGISHEFRTPITLIVGPIEDLLKRADDSLDVDARNQLTLARKNAGRLNQLVDELLDLVKLEAGSMPVLKSRNDVVKVVDDVVSAFSPLADREGVTLQMKSDPGHIFFCFDREKLEKVIGNLLSNALKFTPAGGHVLVNVEERADEVVLHVRDTGCGIPPNSLPHIFDQFYQVEDAYHPQHGTGIGLYLVKELLELHDGTIDVESEPGFGSLFTVRLPRGHERYGSDDSGVNETALPERPYLAAIGDSRPAFAYSGCNAERHGLPRILIVEDHPDVRAYFHRHLAGFGTIIEAQNGREALERLKDENIDLILTDIMMPEMDGLTLCRKLKSNHLLKHIPIIIVSARAGVDERVAGLEAGADDYLEKPFQMEELLARIKTHLTVRRELREQVGHHLAINSGAIEITSTDEAFHRHAQQIVEQNISNAQFTVEGFAEEIGLSKSQLTRRLKQVTGQSPANFVREIRLQCASHLLKKPGVTVSEVAFRIGYTDPEYFSHIFRERFGIPPSQYGEDGA